MAINTRDKLVAALATATKLSFGKASVAGAAGTFISWWAAAGNPAAGTTPTTPADCNDATPGGIPLPAAGGLNLHLGRLSVSAGTAGTLLVYDRLCAMGGLSGTVITPTYQTVNLTLAGPYAQNRCAADGSDVEWFLQWYAATGSSTTVVSALCTDQTDAAHASELISLAATRPIAYNAPIFSANSTKTIKSVTSLVLTSTTGSAGNFGVTARKRIAEIPVPAGGGGSVLDYAQLGLPAINENSCLEFVWLASTTSTGAMVGGMSIVAG